MLSTWYMYKIREIENGWMGHLSDIMIIMFGLLVILTINRKLHKSAIDHLCLE
jgi:hypothetical protein